MGELHAKLGVGSGMWEVTTGCESYGMEGAWLRCRWAAAGPGRTTRRRAEPPNSDQAPLVWRAPEGPEGTGGLRGAAPNEVRPPSLAGGRALRRPKHPWGHKQHKQEGRRPPAHQAPRPSGTLNCVPKLGRV